MIVEIGMIGALLLLGAWLFETAETIKERKALVDLRFAAIYAVANVFLVAYSWLRQDYVFLAIAISILTLVTFEIIFTLCMKKDRRRRR